MEDIVSMQFNDLGFPRRQEDLGVVQDVSFFVYYSDAVRAWLEV